MTARHGFQNPGRLAQRPRSTRLKLGALAGMGLWLLIWSGYNSGPWYVLHPNFPASNLELIHGVRAFFPFLAGWLSILYLLTQRKVRLWVFEGPLALMLLYAAVGAISSLLLSTEWFSALYWDLAYGSVALVGIAILSTDQPLETASSVLTLSGIIAVIMTLGIMIGLPLIGGPTVVQSDPLALHAMSGSYATSSFMGMAGTRNTGFARYAAVAGLYALGRMWQGRTILRSFWFVVLLISGYCLIAAQGRSEIVAFMVGSVVILMLRRSRRMIFVVWGIGLAALMWSAHFFDRFWHYGTRTGHFDPTLTGRTVLWQEGWELFKHSPWIGLGFQADRYFPPHQQISNTLMHALVQTGLLGTLAFIIAMILAVVLMARLYIASQVRRSTVFRDEVPGLLAFFIVLSITESNAFFSANWLLLAPVLTYIQVLAWQQGVLKGRARSAYGSAVRMGRRAWAFHSPDAAGEEGLPR